MEIATKPLDASLVFTSATTVPARAVEALYRPITSQLQAVEQRLRIELNSHYAELRPLLAHGVMLGGKRMRPALVLLAGAASGPLQPEHVTVATVVEMVHTATLIHDDVLDGASSRRHLPTLNARWSNGASILLGDFLFAHSYSIAAELESTIVCREVGRAARRVCEGELRQFLLAGDVSIDQERYFQLIRGKTAELTSVSCRLGALYSGASDRVVQGLGDYGDALGMAFQIADDYLDIWGTDSRVGKTLGSDVGQGKATLPLIRLLETASAQLRSNILDIMSGPSENRLQHLMPLFNDSDARDFTLDTARNFSQQALDSLSVLPPSAARESLARLAEFAVQRDL